VLALKAEVTKFFGNFDELFGVVDFDDSSVERLVWVTAYLRLVLKIVTSLFFNNLGEGSRSE